MSKIAYALGLGISVGVALVSAASIWYFNKKRNEPPKKWRRVGTIEKINIFPVKSCGVLKLNGGEEISCDKLGLRLQGCHDRTLMLINENCNMITARTFPRMVLIASELVAPTKIKFTAHEMEDLVVDFATLQSKGSKEIRTAVWSTEMKVYLCGQKYDKWFSKFILQKDLGLRLVHYPVDKPVKAINSRMLKEPHITSDDRGAFNDATSYMLINLASVVELSKNIEPKVSPLQFRGSFELKMDISEPYAEDYWLWVKIGDNVTFRKVAPCTRCIFPNVNVTTGIPDSNREPQNTLKRTRTFEDYASPVFGIHLGIRQPGTIKVNDVVYVEEN